jgi:putative transposase
MLSCMPNYRREWTPGGTWFFTVSLLERRRNELLTANIDHLRDCVALERTRRPFTVIAWVVLPEHMHWIWRLPEGDADFATRWRRIKTDFSRGVSKTERRSTVRLARGERGIWQRRYWEHAIRDDLDLQRHIDYIHFNPVKHGRVGRAVDWPYSSFLQYVSRGIYPEEWANEQ